MIAPRLFYLLIKFLISLTIGAWRFVLGHNDGATVSGKAYVRIRHAVAPVKLALRSFRLAGCVVSSRA